MPPPQKKATATISHYGHSARVAETCLENPKMVLEGTSGTIEAERRGKGVSVSVGACFCLPPFRNREGSVQTVWCQTDAEDRALLLAHSQLLHRSLLPALSSQTQLPQTAGNSVTGAQGTKPTSAVDIKHPQLVAHHVASLDNDHLHLGNIISCLSSK